MPAALQEIRRLSAANLIFGNLAAENYCTTFGGLLVPPKIDLISNENRLPKIIGGQTLAAEN